MEDASPEPDPTLHPGEEPDEPEDLGPFFASAVRAAGYGIVLLIFLAFVFLVTLGFVELAKFPWLGE